MLWIILGITGQNQGIVDPLEEANAALARAMNRSDATNEGASCSIAMLRSSERAAAVCIGFPGVAPPSEGATAI